MNKTIKFLTTLLLLAVSVGAWAQTANVGDNLWLEEFKGGGAGTQFSATNNWSNYLYTTLLSGDASALSYTSANAMASAGSASNMTDTHVWLNKNTTAYIMVSGIPLYNTTKVKISWAQAGASKVSVSYAFDGNSTFTELSSNSSASKQFVSSELDVTGHTTINLKFQRTNTNTNVRIDNLTLFATEVGSSVPTCATPSFSPAAGTYTSAQDVTISTETDGATIYFTTDGNDPTTNSSVYSSAINVSSTTTLKAMAVKEGMGSSTLAEATYVILGHEGTETDPYTIADARAAIDANTGITGVYATGIVSEIVTAYNSQYGNISYNISTDGTTTADQLQAYRGKSYNGENFTSADDVQVGDVVVIFGNLKKHEETYEFDANSQLVSLDRPVRPIINADDIEITYDATIGEIAYTIKNSIEGGTLTASTQDSWLAPGTVGTTVPFTCEANNTAAERTATVTLTYNYGDNETVTKNVTVTQTGNPNLVDDISDITEVGSSYKVRGTVVATNSKGFILGDGTGYVYVYQNAVPTVAVNDMVMVEGTTGTYGNIIQFTNTATVTESTTSNYNGTPAATFITEVPDYSEGYHISTYFEYKGELTKTNGNYLITVGDQDIQISYPTTEQGTALTALVGKLVHVKGYFSGINSSSHFTTMLESVEEVEFLDNAINGLEDAYTIDMTQDEYDLTFNATATSGADVLYEVIAESTTIPSDGYEFEDGYLMVSKKGTIVIRAYVEADDEYKAAEKTTTVTVIGEKDDAVIVVADANVSYGSTFTVDESTIEGGAITVTSSNTSVATVNGLVITPAAVGSTTITVATAENDSYKAGSETFTLTVTAPQGQSTAPSADAVQVFYESFDESTGTTGWSGSTANGEIRYDNTGWDANKGNGNGGSAKFGTSSVMGYAITPAIGEAGDFTMTFKSGAWSGDKTEGGLVLSIDEGEGTLSQTTFDLDDSQWSDYEVIITGATANTKIKFSAAQATKNRFFLDEVKIEKPAEAVVAPKLTLSAYGYASYCCQYPLDFTSIDKNTFKAWYVSAVDMTSGDVTFSEITETIKGGEAFFLYGTPGAECQLAYANSCETTLEGNQLEGTLAPTYVENGNGIQNYGLSGGNFVKMGNGVVKANKSYLPVEVGTETPARFNIIFESQEATGIMNVSREGTTDNRYYNLNGQRVMNPTKGMYIVNGKKVIIK